MADVNAAVGIKIKATDESATVVANAEKAVKGFDKTLKESSKDATAVGKAAKTASKDFDTLGASAGKSSKGLDAVDKSAEKSADSVKGAGKTAEESAAQIKSLSGTLGGLLKSLTALAAVAGIVIVPVVETASFNRSMAEVRGVLGDVTDNEFKDLTDVARQLGATTEFSAQQAADGLKFLAQAGFTAVESIEALPGVLSLAQAGNVGLGEAADIASNILTGMALPVSELGRVNDVLVQGFTSTNTSLSELGHAFSYVAPIAAGFGISVEETTAAIGLLSNAGIKASTAGTTLRGVLTRLAAPGKKAAGVMAAVAKRIGQASIEILDSNGKFLSLSKVIGQFEEAGLTAVEAIGILGQEAGPGLVALVSQGAKAFDALNDKLLDSAGRADAVAKIIRDTFVGDFKSAQSAVSELALSIGDQLIPAARWLVQIFSDLVTWSSDLVKAYPTLVPLVAGLAGAFTALAVAINSIGVAKTLGPLVATNWAAGIAGVKAFTTTIVTGFTTAKAAVLSFAASNPILLAVVAALAVATTAYAIFGKSAEDAAEKHRKNAASIGESRRKLTDEVRELERIKEILSEEIPGSEKFIKAQQRMAELLPGTNVYLDEQGRLLADVGGNGEDAAAGLDKYISKLKGEEQFAFADQLEETQKALTASSKGLKDYSKNLKDWYGVGQDSTSLVQDFWRGVNKLTGTYRRNIKAGTDLRESYKKSGAELDKLLGQALRSGLSVDGLTDALSKNKVGAEESSAIITRYTKLVAGTEEAHRAAAEEARRSGKATIDSYAEPVRTVEELKEELTNLKKVSSELGKALKSENKIVSDGLKALKDDYKVLSDAAKSRADSELQSIEDVKRARLAGVAGLTEGKRIVEETRIIKDAYRSRVSAIQTFVSESESLLRAEEATRRDLAGKGGGNPAQVEVDILAKRKAIYTETVSSYRSMVDQMISEEQRHLNAVRQVEDEKKSLRDSTEDKIRALQRKALTEDQQYADKVKEIDQKQSAAKRALAEGDYAEAKRLNEQARSLAESSIRSGVVDDAGVKAAKDALSKERDKQADSTAKKTDADKKTIRDLEKRVKIAEDAAKQRGEALEKQSIQKTISELKQSEAIGQQILNQMAADHQAAAEAIASDRQNLQNGLQDAEQKLQELNNKLLEISSVEIEIETRQINEAIQKVNEISAALTELDGKIARTTVITTQRTVEARAAGGPVGMFKRLMSPVIRAGGGLTDDVPAMLKREEFVMNPKATRKYGMGFMHLINSGRFTLDAIPRLAAGGEVVPDLKPLLAMPIPREILNAGGTGVANTDNSQTMYQTLNINGKSGILSPRLKDLGEQIAAEARFERRRQI